MNLESFVVFCKFNEISFSNDLESFELFRSTWEKIYEENLSFSIIKKYILELEKNNYSGVFKKTSRSDRIKKFSNYSIKNNLFYERSLEGNKELSKTWYKFFNINISMSTASKYILEIKRLGYKQLFILPKTPSSVRREEFLTHCNNKGIVFSSGTKGAIEYKKEYQLFFNSSISIATGKRHIQKIVKFKKDIIKERKSKEEKILFFLEYCKNSEIVFYKNKDTYIRIVKYWKMIHKIVLTVTTARKYYADFKKLNIKFGVIKQYTKQLRISHFIKYCIETNISFFSNDDGAYKIQKYWHSYYQIKLSINIAKEYQQIIKNTNSNLIKEEKTINDNENINDLNEKIIHIEKHLIKEKITFNSNYNEYIRFQELWNSFFNFNTTFREIKKIINQIKRKDSKIFYSSNLSNKIQLFIQENGRKDFFKTKEGYSELKEIWNRQFNENISDVSIRKYVNLIIKSGEEQLFKYKNIDMQTILNKIVIHCKENAILIDRGNHGYLTIQKICYEYFKIELTITTAIKYSSLLRKQNHFSIFKKTLSVNEKIDIFLKYIMDNKLKFLKNEAGYLLLMEKWNSFFNENLKLSSFQFQLKKISIRNNSKLFIEKNLLDTEKAILFIKKCRESKLLIKRGKSGYLQVQEEWNNFFDESNNFKKAITLHKLIRRTEDVEDIFIKKNLTLKEKYFQFFLHCKKEKIHIKNGEEGTQEIISIWYLCFNNQVVSKTAEKYATELRKYSGLFVENKFINNSKFKLFKYYCIKNEVIFNAKSLFKSITEKWREIYKEELSTKFARTIMANLSFSNNTYYYDTNHTDNNEIYIHIIKYHISKNLSLTSQNTTNDHIKKLWRDFYNIIITDEEASVFGKFLLKEFKIYDKAKVIIFGEYCKKNAIYFLENKDRDEKIQLAWRECFDYAK